MSRLPVPEKSQALFIGVDEFDSLEDLPAVGLNLATLVDLFAGEVWGLGTSRCHQLLNPASMREVDEAIFRSAQAASDTFLLYYAGHGLLDLKGRLHLAMPGSDQSSVHSTAFPYDWVRMGMSASPAQRCIVILDCCFSARAMGVQSSGASVVELAEAEGTYVLAAAAENAFALAPPGDPYTAFTGALLRVLTDGISDAPELLDLDTTFMGMQSILKRQGRPDPQCLGRNQVGRTFFVRNSAYVDEEEEAYSLQESFEELHRARSLADTLQTVADGLVTGLGYEKACVNLIRPDGDLVAAAFAGDTATEALIMGRIGSREAWELWLCAAEEWGTLRFVPHSVSRGLDEDAIPLWCVDDRSAHHVENAWQPADRLFAPLHSSAGADLLGVISVGRPLNGRRPGREQRAALQSYAFQATIAISNARLRANMQRALVRLEREQQEIRASEESFRQAFEYAPSGMAIAEIGGNQHGRLLRSNDALCRLLDRPATALRRYSLADLVHPEDIGTLLQTSAEGGRAELRLVRRDGTYAWVSLRNSIVADTLDGPRFLLTHVEEIEERKLRELQLLHQVAHDALTGLPNVTELRRRLDALICSGPREVANAGRQDSTFPHKHLISPQSPGNEGSKGLAVLVFDLDGFKSINDRFGHYTGDAVLMEVARRLTDAAPNQAEVARIGGNEFAVFSDGLDLVDAQDLAVRLRHAIIPAIRVDERVIRTGASFGIGWARCGMTAQGVLKSADEEMYAERKSRPQRRSTG